MPVEVLEVPTAVVAVEGAVGPAHLEQRADGPAGTGPALGTRARDRRQRQAARARGVALLAHGLVQMHATRTIIILGEFFFSSFWLVFFSYWFREGRT